MRRCTCEHRRSAASYPCRERRRYVHPEHRARDPHEASRAEPSFPAARRERKRRHHPHQPRTKRSRARRRAGRERGRKRVLDAGIRHRRDGSRLAPFPLRAAHLHAHRRRGRNCCEQQCRSSHDGALRIRRRSRSYRLARRARRDRRVVPHPRHHGAITRHYGGSRRHEQDAPFRLRASGHARHGHGLEGASLELPPDRLHGIGRHLRAAFTCRRRERRA